MNLVIDVICDSWEWGLVTIGVVALGDGVVNRESGVLQYKTTMHVSLSGGTKLAAWVW